MAETPDRQELLTALTTEHFTLGVFTFMRLAESGDEDLLYGRAINRIRHHYIELAGDQARLFMLSGHDDVAGVFRNMALDRRERSRTSPPLT